MLFPATNIAGSRFSKRHTLNDTTAAMNIHNKVTVQYDDVDVTYPIEKKNKKTNIVGFVYSFLVR